MFLFLKKLIKMFSRGEEHEHIIKNMWPCGFSLGILKLLIKDTECEIKFIPFEFPIQHTFPFSTSDPDFPVEDICLFITLPPGSVFVEKIIVRGINKGDLAGILKKINLAFFLLKEKKLRLLSNHTINYQFKCIKDFFNNLNSK